MIRRTLAVLLIFSLLVTCCTGLSEEYAYIDPFAVYKGHFGSIGFSLPGMPLAVIPENDNEGFWRDSVQMLGKCAYDGSEYQLRSADIAPWIENIKQNNPDMNHDECVDQALFVYATTSIGKSGGTLSNQQVNNEEHSLSFQYVHPDNPESIFEAKCCMDGTRAVCLFMTHCDHSDQAAASICQLSKDEYTADFNIQPYTYNLNGIQMTFPEEPVIARTGDAVTAVCFADDFTRMIAQYVPVSVTLDTTKEEAADSLKEVAETTMQSLGGATVESGEITGTPELWEYEFTALVNSPYNTTARDAFLWIGKIIAGEKGIWLHLCTNSETGRAWLESIEKDLYLTAAIPAWVEQYAAYAEDEQYGSAVATLPRFILDIYGLFQTGGYSEWISMDNIQIGDAVYSNGQWVRTMSLGYSDLFALLFLSSADQTAAINGIHVLASEKIDQSVFASLSACFFQTAEGTDIPDDSFTKMTSIPDFCLEGRKYQAKGGRVEKEGQPAYNLMTINALQTVPIQPEEADIPAASWKTVEEFSTDWNRFSEKMYAGKHSLEAAEQQKLENGKIIHCFIFDTDTVVSLTTDSEDVSSVIQKVRVHNLRDNPSQAYFAGLMAFAVLTDMSQDQFISMNMMLEEYPLWGDLIMLTPVVGWNGKMMVLSEQSLDDQHYPSAAVLNMVFSEIDGPESNMEDLE